MQQLHRVTLRFDDGDIAAIEASEDESLHAAALRQKLRLVSDCLEGVCASCKAICKQGQYTSGACLSDALSADEIGMNYILACQTFVRSDCVIDLPYGLSFVAGGSHEEVHPCRIARLERVGESVMLLELAPEAGRRLSFVAGQYAQVGIPGTSVTRRYSFANSPENCTTLRFYVRLISGGAMSQYLQGVAREGDSLTIKGPMGRFHLKPLARPVLMVAGGTGLAPFLSMLEELRACASLAQPVHLLLGLHSEAHAFALDRLKALARELPGFQPQWIFEQPARGGTGGRVTSLLRTDLIHGNDCDAYLCGPPPMINSARNWLVAQGVPPGQIHAEEFLSS